jgi:hypothetical protein
MIREHQFNSAWWGGKVGIVDNPEFFSDSLGSNRAMLETFEWAEFRSPLSAELPLARIRDAGFVFVDTQVNFRIGLARLQSSGEASSCAESLSLAPASSGSWQVDTSDWAIFGHERFRLLPGITLPRLNQRYARWATELVANSPESCFEIRSAAGPEGWYFGKPNSDGSIDLTLGVMRSDARISGYAAYEAVLGQFARLGYRVGQASFSIGNTPVHNIYARMGARFVNPAGVWLWVRST